MKIARFFILFLIATACVHAQSNAIPAAAVPIHTKAAESVAPADLSKGASDVVKLFRAGKPENVLSFYVRYSELEYNLSGDHIIHLKTIGISTNLISAMMETD